MGFTIDTSCRRRPSRASSRAPWSEAEPSQPVGLGEAQRSSTSSPGSQPALSTTPQQRSSYNQRDARTHSEDGRILNTPSPSGAIVAPRRRTYMVRITSEACSRRRAEAPRASASRRHEPSLSAPGAALVDTIPTPKPRRRVFRGWRVIHRSRRVGDNFGDNFLERFTLTGVTTPRFNPQVCNILWTYGFMRGGR